jgi:3-dehydroquinate synthase
VQIDCDYAQHITEATRDRARAAVIISDSMKDKVAQFPSLECEFHYFYIPDGEAGKSIETIKRLWDWLGAAGFTRSDVVIAIGGGAITDVAGFAASTWLRGIDWIAVPTTVAGMVDAAIGGKTGINSDYGKNLIGAFYSPLSVVIDLQWLETLSDRDFAAGLAEVVKCGFIADPLILEALEGKSLSEICCREGIGCF